MLENDDQNNQNLEKIRIENSNQNTLRIKSSLKTPKNDNSNYQ